jgi:hypothetical protein
MWTRSIPAVRALYEGMHLYDQGRYAEGWLKFRDASREDKNYVEAVYWVGKMYYFMYRYDHARRTLERFVYLNCLHPRMGDALMEYAGTFEDISSSPRELLSLYAAFGQRFRDMKCGELPGDDTGTDMGWYSISKDYIARMAGDDWARYKSARLLGQLGRNKDAAIMTAPATQDDGLALSPSDCILNLLRCNALTGQVPDDDVIARADWPRVKHTMLHFSPGKARQQYQFVEPVTIIGRAAESTDKFAAFWSDRCRLSLYLLAPSGYVFKSLRFEPVAEGADATMAVSLGMVGFSNDIDKPKVAPLDSARGEGLVPESVPASGMLMAHCIFDSINDKSAAVIIRGVTVIARLEKVANPGSIDVQCQDTQDFRADVDGVFGRWWPGLVGPLAAGEHTVTFRPTEPNTPYGEWSTKVSVDSGKVARVVGRLPWKDANAAASTVTAWIGRDYDAYDSGLNARPSPPAVQVDDQAIRMVWSRGGDLWSSVSADGNTFSPPRRLPLPVSTSWAEFGPRLIRDESGRFVLTFISDRDGLHRNLVYVCWSRDFANWSAPALILDREPYGYSYDFVQDSRGRFICVLAGKQGTEFVASGDGYKWDPLPGGPDGGAVQLLAMDAGRLELFARCNIVGKAGDKTPPPPSYPGIVHFVNDGAHGWSRGEVLTLFQDGLSPVSVSATRAQRGAAIIATSQDYLSLSSRATLIWETDGDWLCTRSIPGLMRGMSTIAFHSRWGYVIAWMSGKSHSWLPHAGYGPYMMRSARAPALLAEAGRQAPPPEVGRAAPSRPGSKLVVENRQWRMMTEELKSQSAGRKKLIVVDAEGRVTSMSLEDAPAGRKSPPTAASRPSPRTNPGDLTYTGWAESGGGGMHFRMDKPDEFHDVPSGEGLINRHPTIVILQWQGIDLRTVLDSREASSPHYDILRIVSRPASRLEDAAIVNRVSLAYSPKSGKWTSHFKAESVDLKVGGRVVPVGVDVLYEEGESRLLSMTVGTSAQGMCMFGKRLHPVTLYDMSGNLRVGDPASPDGNSGCDWVVVDLGNGHATSYYGQPVLVDDELYDVRVSSDGGQVTARKHSGPTGTLRVDHPDWSALLLNKDTRSWIRAGNKPVPLPVGRYKLANYTEYPPEASGKLGWRLTCWDQYKIPNVTGDRSITVSQDKSPVIDVRAGQALDVGIGSPIKGELKVSVSDRTVNFHYAETDAAGQNVAVIFETTQEELPQRGAYVTIIDLQNRPVDRIALHWQPDSREGTPAISARANGSWRGRWQLPANTGGSFTAKLEREAGPFAVKAPAVTFSVK